MTPDELKSVLSENVGKRLRVSFADGLIQDVDIETVDDEGFTHSGPDGAQPNHYWTRFESVTHVSTRPD